jgi:TPR repeat protein
METEISHDLREAAHYLKLSADQGDAGAQFHSAVCLFRGEEISQDSKRQCIISNCEQIKQMP